MNGIIYYNIGTKCIPRLVVSIHSLRKYYDGPITILSSGKESNEYCNKIAGYKKFKVDVKEVQYNVPDGDNRVFLETCLCHTTTPYDITIWVDSDTLFRKPGITDLWDIAEKHEFAVAQFSNWLSSGKRIAKRILSWAEYYPEMVEQALKFGPAINSGILGFRKDAKVMQNWYNCTLPGRSNFIPNEICLQVILHMYPHKIISQKYNCSCKYGDPLNEETVVIHYHGRKHCRKGLPFCANLWVDEYRECIKENIINLGEIAPKLDKYVRHLAGTK